MWLGARETIWPALAGAMTVSGKEEALCRDPTQAECAAQIDLALPDDAAVLLSSSAYARFDGHRPRGQ